MTSQRFIGKKVDDSSKIREPSEDSLNTTELGVATEILDAEDFIEKTKEEYEEEIKKEERPQPKIFNPDPEITEYRVDATLKPVSSPRVIANFKDGMELVKAKCVNGHVWTIAKKDLYGPLYVSGKKVKPTAICHCGLPLFEINKKEE